MILIAENLNSSIPKISQAIQQRDGDAIRSIAEKLDQSKAAYLDVNAGTFHEDESGKLTWLIDQVVGSTKKPLVVDSPNPQVLADAIDHLQLIGWQPALASEHQPRLLLNSITLEQNRLEPVLALAHRASCGVIALLMDTDSMPEGVEQRLDIASRLYDKLTGAGILPQHIFFDPMVRPVATDDQAGLEALTVIQKLRQNWPQAHVTVGLSNISFGLPARRHLNRAFLLQGMAMGLDSAILNPLDEELMSLHQAGSTLTGQDEYCMDYLTCFRPKSN